MLAIENEKTKQIEIECNRDIKVAEANAKQAEENRKTAEENRIAKQIELKIIKESKNIKNEDKDNNNNNNNNNNINNNISLQFLEECTIHDPYNHIHCTTLYVEFKEWYKQKFQGRPIPSNKEFIDKLRLKNQINFVHKIKINNLTQLGIRNTQIIKH
jgi:hypothetical protein